MTSSVHEGPSTDTEMPERVLMKGNEAIAEAAIQAGCDAYFGYPITPQAELLEWMARRMPEEGRAFIQAESELAAINMALGAAATGSRVLVSSSSPGISLMAEAMSYMAASELPVVLVNVMRGGPGLGSIGPAQADYLQATKGHGHGDYRTPVLAPASIGEAMALVADAFELAERYRTPVMILADGILGQAMEPVVPAYRCPPRLPADWAVEGADGRPPRIVRSLHLQPEALEAHNRHLQAKYAVIVRDEVRWAGEQLEDAELVIVAYGTAARVARTAVDRARQAGLRVGLFRPITLWPFPEQQLRTIAERSRGILALELAAGQLLDDVRLAVEGRAPVAHLGRTGGMVPSPGETLTALRHLFAVTEPPAVGHRRSTIEPEPLERHASDGSEPAEWPAEPDPLSLVEDAGFAEARATSARFGDPDPSGPPVPGDEADPPGLIADADWAAVVRSTRDDPVPAAGAGGAKEVRS